MQLALRAALTWNLWITSDPEWIIERIVDTKDAILQLQELRYVKEAIQEKWSNETYVNQLKFSDNWDQMRLFLFN